MANNRLWLVHRPSGAAVMLGKRLADGWYNPPSVEAMNTFFEAAAMEGHQDDFVLAIEDAAGAPRCSEDWAYVPDNEGSGWHPGGPFTIKTGETP